MNFAADTMFTIVPIFMVLGAGLFVLLIIFKAAGRNKASGRKHRVDQDAMYNPLLDSGNPASPLFPSSNSEGITHSSSPPSDSSSQHEAGHSGGFDGGGHGGGHH